MTTITKKTTLLKQLEHVVVGSMTAVRDSGDTRIMLNGIVNEQAILGYDGTNVTADVSFDGGEPHSLNFHLNGGGEAQCMTSYGESGQTVKVTVKINPEKTGFDQTPIELTGVVA